MSSQFLAGVEAFGVALGLLVARSVVTFEFVWVAFLCLFVSYVYKLRGGRVEVACFVFLVVVSLGMLRGGL